MSATEQLDLITVAEVTTKEGAKDGRAWKLYRVKDTAGNAYSTFDGVMGAAALAAQGRAARISYATTDKGNNLLSFAVEDGSELPNEPVRAQTANGAPDWDMIGLHKTRCALWAAALRGGHTDPGVIRGLVIAAETDIFHRQPADETSDLPF